VLPTISPEARAKSKGEWWWPAWAEAKPDQPPLSWHLRGAEQDAIDEAWTELLKKSSEIGVDKPLPQIGEKEWEDSKGRPIDKVVSFLFGTPELRKVVEGKDKLARP